RREEHREAVRAEEHHEAAVRHEEAHAVNRPNNVYATREGNVVRRTNEGNWEKHEAGGWHAQPAPTRQPEHVQQQRLEAEHQARNYGQQRVEQRQVIQSRPAPQPQVHHETVRQAPAPRPSSSGLHGGSTRSSRNR
ncbi:MAG TPA: hypothetical protein VFF73_00310, partial [Planctomycetota bacterium]|nr:hypothetical protein [Planctomycetota bacterium]